MAYSTRVCSVMKLTVGPCRCIFIFQPRSIVYSDMYETTYSCGNVKFGAKAGSNGNILSVHHPDSGTTANAYMCQGLSKEKGFALGFSRRNKLLARLVLYRPMKDKYVSLITNILTYYSASRV